MREQKLHIEVQSSPRDTAFCSMPAYGKRALYPNIIILYMHASTLLLEEVGHSQSSEVGYERARVVGGGARVHGDGSEAELHAPSSREELVLSESVQER